MHMYFHVYMSGFITVESVGSRDVCPTQYTEARDTVIPWAPELSPVQPDCDKE